MNPRPTRRQFLTLTAAGLAALPFADRASAEITGPAVPKLAAYDELMTAFMREHRPPGAALAVAYHGRLVYARGFGLADVEKHEPVRPDSLFRIASISKPFAATAVMHLIQRGRLKFDDHVFPILNLEPHLEPGARVDPRLREITVRQCLQHTGGWDRDKTIDPMSSEEAENVAKGLKVPLPIPSQADHSLRDGQAAAIHARHGLRLFQFRLLRAGPRDRGDCEEALSRIRGGNRFSRRWASAA